MATSNILVTVVQLLSLTFSGVALGRLVPLRTGASCGGDADDCHPEPSAWSAMNETTTTVATVVAIISLLERSSSSLSKGVLVVAADWSGTDGRFPYAFLRTLQARHEQPVYTADVEHLLADGHRGNGDDDAARVVADDGSPVSLPCRRPASADHHHLFLLPPRSRYVILFRGSIAAATQDPFAQLANLNYTFWDAGVYYLIVVPEFDPNLRQIIHGAWNNLSIYKIVVVTPSAVRVLDPFVHNAVNGRYLNIPLGSLKQIPGVLRSRTKNLHRFPLRFVINNRTPTVITTKDGKYVGQDGEFAAVLAAKMNATPVYCTSELSDTGKIYYGYRQTGKRAYGTFAGVIDGRADVSANGHFLKDYHCYWAELTRHITSDKVCLLAPKAGVIPPMMTVLMSFQREVWMMTAITCIMATIIYYVATALEKSHGIQSNPTGCHLGLEIYRMFIGAPTNRIFAGACQRILTTSCLIFTLVILNAFQGSMVTFLSTPMHFPDINTFKDLKTSNLPIRTSSISFREILIGDPNLKSLAYRVEKWAKEEDIHNSDGRYAGFQRVNVFNLEHFKDVLFDANKNNTRVLHTMHECLISYFISYAVHRNSPYKRRINILLSWIDQAGLVIKWNSDVFKHIFEKYKPINPKDYVTSKVFSVRDLEIAFIVLSFGLILSVIVFIIELLIHKILEKHETHAPVLPFLP